MKTALYLRVSTQDQNLENQRLELQGLAKVRGWEIVATYEDKLSGTKRIDSRPGMIAMLEDARRGKFKLVAAWSIDRLGRSVKDLLEFLQELKSIDVALYTHKQAFDTTTPTGRLMFGMVGLIAEFEREMMVERTRAGLSRARANGKRIGRPPLSAELRGEIARRAMLGEKQHAVSKALKLSWSVVNRYWPFKEKVSWE